MTDGEILVTCILSGVILKSLLERRIIMTILFIVVLVVTVSRFRLADHQLPIAGSSHTVVTK